MMSPGYDTPQYYENFQECSWVVKVGGVFNRFDNSNVSSHFESTCSQLLFTIHYSLNLVLLYPLSL